MIFVTVGTQLPFDRLVRAIDEWALNNPGETVVGQIGAGGYTPAHFEAHAYLTPTQFRQYFRQADLIVGHAGMGTILSALQYRKPLVVMPRRLHLGEHRSDHQMATVRGVSRSHGICAVQEPEQLWQQIEHRYEMDAGPAIDDAAPSNLTQGIREFVITAPPRRSSMNLRQKLAPLRRAYGRAQTSRAVLTPRRLLSGVTPAAKQV
jgi:UDP-N-acetylglucosamine transferase subunit ALG13